MFITPAYAQVHPNFTFPEFIVEMSQASGYMEALATGDPMPRLGSEDLYVYMKMLRVRTRVQAAQAAMNQMPSIGLDMAQISTPTYLVRNRAEYDHHDIANGGNWGLGVPEAARLGSRQGMFQQFRNGGLFGFNPANGEGLLNTPGATLVNLPPDMNGNTTVQTYDNGAMLFFLLAQVQAAKTRTLQMGRPVKISILGPQRTLGAFEYQGIVQVTQFQRQGAGTDAVRAALEAQLATNGDTLEWSYDDTLIGQGAGGNDAVIINIPEIEGQHTNSVDTNEFARITPNISATALQLCDMVAPREIPTPIPGGAIDVVFEMRMTAGWGIRPEALTIASMQYS